MVAGGLTRRYKKGERTPELERICLLQMETGNGELGNQVVRGVFWIGCR